MPSSLEEKVADAGQATVEAVKSASQRVAIKAEDAADWVKEKTGLADRSPCGKGTGIARENMDVIAACGKKVGVVDRVEGEAIKLTRKDSADGQHHYIPVGWIDHVDSHVHLTKNSMETERDWKDSLTACGCGG